MQAAIHGEELCCDCSDVPEHVGGGLFDGTAAKRGRPSTEEKERKETKKATLDGLWQQTGHCRPDGETGSASSEPPAPTEQQQAEAEATAQRMAAEQQQAKKTAQEAERERQKEALRADEYARLAAQLVEQTEAAAQAAQGIKVALPAPRGRMLQDGEPAEAGRLGYISVTVGPHTDARYANSGSFNIIATAALPKYSSVDKEVLIGWGMVKSQTTYRAAGLTLDDRAADANAEANRMVWKLLNPALRPKGPPRQGRRKAAAEDNGGEQQPKRHGRSASTAEAGASTTGTDGRATHNYGVFGNPGGRPIHQTKPAHSARQGQPPVNSAGFCLPEQLAPTAQLAMLRAAQGQVRSLRLQLAQQRTALLASEAEQSDLRRGMAALQRWAAESLASFGDDDAPPISLPDVLGDGAGYTPTERLRTIYNHYQRAFDAISTITGGGIEKIRQLFDYASNRLRVNTAPSISARQLAIQSGVMESLRESFTAARQRTGNGRPPKKLAQALQVVLTWLARAPELGGVSMAAVADALSLGPEGVAKLSARLDVADDFVSTGVFEQLFDDRCMRRSDMIPQGQIDWLITSCWLSNDFTRASEKKGDEVYDPKSRKQDRQHHRKRWLELPLIEFYSQVQERGKAEFGADFHMSSWFIRIHRPFWVKEATRDVCLCRYHLEFDLLAKGFRQLRNAVPCPIDCPACKACPPLSTGLQLRAHLTCPRPEGEKYDAAECVAGTCGRCSDLQLLGTAVCAERRDHMKDHRLKWERYTKQHAGQDISTGEDRYKHDFYDQEGTGEELIEDLKATLKKFNPHHDLAKQQDADWDALKKNFPCGSFVSVQVTPCPSRCMRPARPLTWIGSDSCAVLATF